MRTRIPLPRDVWNELHPTTGEFIRIRNSRLNAGEVFDFFWKPSAWHRFGSFTGLTFVCLILPGESAGPPHSITIDFSGRQTQLYLFDFGVATLKLLSYGPPANRDAVLLDISPIKFWARPPRRHPCISKANAVPPPRSSCV